MTAMTTCGNCRSVFSDQNKFCQRCGAQAPSSGTSWYYATPQGQVGPVPASTITDLIRAGGLNHSSLVWSDGFASWSPIAQTVFATAVPATVHAAATVRPYAGFGRRVGALLLDAVFTGILGGIFGFGVGALLVLGGINPDHEASAFLVAGYVVGFVVNVLYFSIMESSPARATLGKMICRIYVTDERGARISFMRALGRFFAQYLSAIPIGIGYLAMIHDPRGQTWHDRLASTYVLKK